VGSTAVKTILKPHILGMVLSLLFFCSCATEENSNHSLPADVTMNKDAGRGNWLIVTLRLENGEALPFMVDTGSPGTLFDKSLASKLKRLPLGTWTVPMPDEKQKSGIYWEPKLFLGNARLKTGKLCATFDLKRFSDEAGSPIMGILAMDCLKHYCIQMDFQSGTMRFLDDRHLDVAKLGKPFPLKLSLFSQLYIRHAGLAGGKSVRLAIDTGDPGDGQIEKGTFKGHNARGVHLSECVWGGETYTNVNVGNGGDSIGLRFLARHLVTFDFPKRVMYLKQTSVGPLIDETQKADREAAANAAAKSAFQFSEHLKEEGQLPGWSQNDHGMTTAFHFQHSPNLDSVTLDVRKKGDSSIYHYAITRAFKDSPWKLQKAWRTDQNGHTIEEYPVP
jgi:hypothetical protein